MVAAKVDPVRIDQFVAPGFVPLLDWLEMRDKTGDAWSIAVVLYFNAVLLFLGCVVPPLILCYLTCE